MRKLVGLDIQRLDTIDDFSLIFGNQPSSAIRFKGTVPHFDKSRFQSRKKGLAHNLPLNTKL